MIGSVARRYARALFALAKEQGQLEPTAVDVAKAAAIAGDTQIRQVLRNPLLSATRRRDIVELIIREVQPSDLVDRFLRLISDKQRLEDLPGIDRDFRRMLDEELGRVQVDVRTALPPSDAQRDALVAAFSKLTGKEVIPAITVDPELIGGVVVEAEGRVYDGSVKTHFARIAKELAGNAQLGSSET